MKIDNDLNEKLLSQSFTTNISSASDIERYKTIAAGYAFTENSMAVLSDLEERKSYIYYGGVAETLGLGKKGESGIIESIWEKEIFRLVQPSDMDKRNLDELQFFHFMNCLPKNERSQYYLVSCIRMDTSHGTIPVNHRVFYIMHQSNGAVQLALCLYNIASAYTPESYICNTLNGTRTMVDRQSSRDILTEREKEILSLIEQGKLSKDIADEVSISIHTVNRHRQNILLKLRAQNSFEACRIARSLNLL